MRQVDHLSRRLKLRHLNVLVAVVEHGSMVKAAEHLSISQPVVSKAIADLEELLGVQLLDRGPQGIEPTIYGRALVKRSVSLFDDIRTSISELEHLADPTAGVLRIGTTEAFSTTLLPAIINRLSRQYPRLVFDIVLADSTTLLDRDLRGRRVDLVIGRVTEDAADDIDLQFLYRDRIHIVASVTHPLALRRKIKLESLLGERWVLPPPGHPIHRLVVDTFKRGGLQPPRSIVSVGSAPFTSSLIANGHYLGALAASFLGFGKANSGLKLLPIDLAVTARPVSVVTLKTRTKGPLPKLFLDCARELTAHLAKAGL